MIPQSFQQLQSTQSMPQRYHWPSATADHSALIKYGYRLMFMGKEMLQWQRLFLRQYSIDCIWQEQSVILLLPPWIYGYQNSTKYVTGVLNLNQWVENEFIKPCKNSIEQHGKHSIEFVIERSTAGSSSSTPAINGIHNIVRHTATRYNNSRTRMGISGTSLASFTTNHKV